MYTVPEIHFTVKCFYSSIFTIFDRLAHIPISYYTHSFHFVATLPMNTNLIMDNIKQRLEQSQHILLVPHHNPDADSRGSALAFYEYLTQIGKKSSVFQESTPIHRHNVPQEIDCICVFDAGDARYARLENIFSQITQRVFVINIDHHATNELYGDINLVITHQPSTTAICTAYFDYHHIAISETMAVHLLAGLLTDTGSLGNPSTNTLAMETAARLMRRGADMYAVNTTIQKTKNVSSLKLWGRALSRMKKHSYLNLAYTYITQHDVDECDAHENSLEGLANFFNQISDCAITLVLKETEDGFIKGSLRTTHENVDVARLASALDGGGHKKAAGFLVKGKLSTIQNRLTIL